jgi:hypothetical protein
LMALALALVIVAVVVSVALRSEPEGVVAAEVARQSLSEPPRYSSGEAGSATSKSSSEKEPLLGRRSCRDTVRPPMVGRWGSGRGRRRPPTHPSPSLRSLDPSPQCLSRHASKHTRRHGLSQSRLSRSPDHSSTNPLQKKRNPIQKCNPNQMSECCQGRKEPAGPNLLPKRYKTPTALATTGSHLGPSWPSP